MAKARAVTRGTPVANSAAAENLPLSSPASSTAPEAERKGKKLRISSRWVPLLVSVLVLAIAIESYWVYGWFRVQTLIDRAHQRLDLMDYEGAERELAAAEALRPNSPQIALEFAALNRWAGKMREFESWIRNAEAAGAAEEEVLQQILLMKAQQGFVDRDSPEFERLLALGDLSDRMAADVYHTIAKGYLTSYQVRLAEDAINSWLNWQPESVPARFLRGNIRYRYGLIDQSIADYRFVLDKSPEQAEAHLLLGMLLNESGRIEEALTHFQRAVELDPDSTECKLELAYCNRQLGNDETARGLAEELRNCNDPPQRGKALELLAKLAIEAEQYAEARKLLEEAFRSAPGNAELCHMMGTVLSFAGETERARAFTEQAQGFRDRHDRIQEVTRQLIDEPERNDLRLEMAELLFRDGLEESASMWLITILKDDPDHLPSHRLLAAYYQRVGKADLATRHRQRAMELSDKAEGAQEPSTPSAQ